MEYPGEALLHGLIEEQVHRTPDAVAVVFEGASLTYSELERLSNQLAHCLLSKGVRTDSLVGVCMERSLEMVVALVGVLKAGAAYVPLDPAYPKDRLAFMVADARMPVLLAQRHVPLPPHEAHVINLDAGWQQIASYPSEKPGIEAGPDDLAYVIYTSGSTGKPKGAMNTHRGIRNRLLWMQAQYGLSAEDRVLQKTPFSFDVSVWEFFWPLMTGARLVMARPGGHRESDYLVEVIKREAITTLHFVPPMLSAFLDDKNVVSCRGIKRVICSGEALSYELQERFFEVLDAGLHNLYGPTEAAVDVTYWQCRKGDPQRVVPIGKPIANTQIHILDEHLQPVPIGVPGELHIGGVGLARGYLGRAELTAEKFIPDPFSGEKGARLYKTGDLARWREDGNVLYLGRMDHQVKIRGFRIELGEIESALRSHPAIVDCIVTAPEEAFGTKRLVAYIISRRESSTRQFRDFLLETLPEYMVPTAFVSLESFPVTANGKVNRAALPAANGGDAMEEISYVPPQGWVQKHLVEIWEELLQVRPIGITDDFFEKGGHSLLAVRMCARVEKTIGRKLAPATLFENATIEHLASVLARRTVIERNSPLITVQARGDKTPFFFLHGDFQDGGLYCINLVRRLGNDRPFHAIDPHGLDGGGTPLTIEAMAASRLETLLQAQKKGPYLLGGYCNGGLVALEMARQLKRRGEKVGALVMISADATNARFRPLYRLSNIWSAVRMLDERERQQLFLHWREQVIFYKASVRHHLAALGELRGQGSVRQFSRVRRKAVRVLKRLLRIGTDEANPLRPDLLPCAVVEGGIDVSPLYFSALRSYVPEPYDGKVILLREADAPLVEWMDESFGWRKVAKDLVVHQIPGGHFTALTVDTNIAILAERLKTSLDQADEELRKQE